MQNVYMGLDVEEFIFGEGTTYEENYNISNEEMNAFGIIECTEDPDVACYKIALENEQNHNAIMMAMLTQEYNHVLENGYEMIYEGSKLSNFFEMVKKNVQKFWAKVKGVFKKVMDQISSIVLSNKAFVKKYRASANSLKAVKNKDFTGYEFPDDMVIKYADVVPLIRGLKNDSESTVKGTDVRDGFLNSVRFALAGSGVTAENFSEKLKEKLYGSVNTKTIPLSNDFSKLLNDLETAADVKKAAKDSHKEAEKAVKGLLNEVKTARAEAEHGSNAEKLAKNKAEAINKSLTLMSTALSVQTRAIVAKAVQDRKMANYYVNAQNNKKLQESTVEGFDNVELI